MYVPKDFAEQNQEKLVALMQRHPLCTLVSLAGDGFTANHLPLLALQESAERIVLQGHVARANPFWKDVGGSSVLAIFQAAQAYISPGWYPSKKEHGKVVPTWNYKVVHAHGDINIVHDDAWKLAFLTRLTAQQESKFATPWAVSDAPPEYTERMLRGIVGFEIVVTQLIGKFKASQNKPLADRQGVRAGLAKAAEPDLEGLSGVSSDTDN